MFRTNSSAQAKLVTRFHETDFQGKVSNQVFLKNELNAIQ